MLVCGPHLNVCPPDLEHESAGARAEPGGGVLIGVTLP